MRVLLDTHALLWAAKDEGGLSPRASSILVEGVHTVYVSAVSAWEIATKYRLGKLPGAAELIGEFEIKTAEAGYRLHPISCQHGLVAGSFPQPHRDPFDRLLAAQALMDGMVMLSNDKALDAFGVQRIW